MATNSSINVTEGSGKRIASFSITEDALTKELQRIVLTDDTGAQAIRAEDSAGASGHPGVPILGVRQDVDGSPVGTDGDYQFLQFNQQGRLKVATMPGDYSATVDDITAIADTVVCDVSRASNVMLYCTGTFSTVNCTFEGSIDGGVTWFGVQAVRSNANTVETTTGNLSAAPAYGWEMSVNAMTHVRVRATAWTSGTQTWRILPGAYATEPIPAIQTAAVTGSGNFAVTMAASATGSPAKAEDAAHASADVGVMALGVRYETTNAAPTSAANDYGFIQIDHMGKTVTMPYSTPVNQVQGITAAMTGTGDTQVLAAGAASVRNYVTGIHVVNTHATVGTEVQIKDGSTVIDRFYVAALSEQRREYPTPLKGTAATALNAANVTTGSNTYVQAVGFLSI